MILVGRDLLPHELVAKHVVPELRGLLVHRLNDKGFGQLRIARSLGISQPMVSKYLSVSSSEYLDRLSSLGLDAGEVLRTMDILAECLLSGKYYDYFKLLNTYLNSILKDGLLCNYHKRLSSLVPKSCDLCFKAFERAEDPYVEEVRTAYELLSLHPRGSDIIPEVGMNIVAAPPNAGNFKDVVGYSGRIVRINNKVFAVGEPIRGGSKHTANVLLTVMRRFHGVRSTVVVKYDRSCIEKLLNSGLNVVETGPHSSVEDFFTSLEDMLYKLSKEPDVIADAGGLGIEPVVYVFSGSAINAVKKALKCVE
ncbi:MAG: thiamine-phosphate synthase family protein [Zestosphaera sp.]